MISKVTTSNISTYEFVEAQSQVIYYYLNILIQYYRSEELELEK